MNLSTPLLHTVFFPSLSLLDEDEGQKADGKVPFFKVYSQTALQIGFLGQCFPVHVWTLNISGRPALIHWHRLSLPALAGPSAPIKTRFFWTALPCAVNPTFPRQRAPCRTNCQSPMPLHKLSNALTQTWTLNMHFCSDALRHTSLLCHSCALQHRQRIVRCLIGSSE